MWHLVVLLGVTLPSVAGLQNGVGATPAMGWNSWNFFRCNINETLIKQVTDAIVASGLRDAGYKYVNIDDCWMEKRGPDGRIQPFKDKFPSGMKALADYVHSKGLLFGVYSDTGNKTCEGYPGSWGYEKLDAQTYAEWGVDYLKYDYCNMDNAHEPTEVSYTRMLDALQATGRPILYSLCSWGAGEPWKWGSKVGNSWRVGIDVFAAWDDAQASDLVLPNFLQPILRAVSAVERLAEHAGPGGFNDPDMLVVGLDGMFPYGIVSKCPKHIPNCRPGEYISRDRWGKVGGLSATEQRTHFSLWCMLAAPLILGNDPRHMSKTTLSILTAPEILAINQDVLGKQATKVWIEGDLSIWVKPLSDGRLAALLFNAGNTATDIVLNFTRDLGQWSRRWEREVPWLEPVCVDKNPDKCKGWAKDGECDRNPVFMFGECMASCPGACLRPLGPPGPKATAFIRDAWVQEDLGPSTAIFRAHLVEPHEAKVLLLKFVEPQEARDWTQPLPAIHAPETHLLAKATQQQGYIGVQDETAAALKRARTKMSECYDQLSSVKSELTRCQAKAQVAALLQSDQVQALSHESPVWLMYVLLFANVLMLFVGVSLLKRKGKRPRPVF